MSHLLERAIDDSEKIVRGVVQRLDVGVADHPEQVGADDLHVRKQLAKVGADHVLEKRELGRWRPVAVRSTGRARSEAMTAGF